MGISSSVRIFSPTVGALIVSNLGFPAMGLVCASCVLALFVLVQLQLFTINGGAINVNDTGVTETDSKKSDAE